MIVCGWRECSQIFPRINFLNPKGRRVSVAGVESPAPAADSLHRLFPLPSQHVSRSAARSHLHLTQTFEACLKLTLPILDVKPPAASSTRRHGDREKALTSRSSHLLLLDARMSIDPHAGQFRIGTLICLSYPRKNLHRCGEGIRSHSGVRGSRLDRMNASVPTSN